ncbi:MAG TPA: ATP-binding protein [Rariglobus sp.]|jgi:signal transduction histidine kinase|nr:ATP-binding protein [Rariglobus sp.]
MNLFQLAPLIAGISNLLLSVFVITRDFRSLTNRIFFYWGLSLSIWTFGAFSLFRVQDATMALAIARILHFGVIFLPVLYTHLAILITGIPMRRVLPWAYLISILLAFSNLTDYFIAGIHRVDVVYYAVAGPLYWVLSNMVTILGSVCVWLMFKRRRALTTLHRRRVSAMISALALLMVLGAHDLFPILGIYRYPGTSVVIYPLGTLAAFMFPVVVSYSVLQNQLLDIRFALGRLSATLVRLLFFFSIGFGLLFICALVIPGKFTFSSFVASLVVMLISGCISSVFFPKLLGAGAESLERRILGDRFEYQEQLRGFIESIHVYTDTNRLLDDLEGLLLTTMRASSYHIVILDPHTNQLIMQRGHPANDALPDINLGSPVLDLFRKHPQDFLDFRLARPISSNTNNETDALALFSKLQPELCLPLYSNQEPFGFILLGKKQAETSYTAQDLELLISLAKNLSLVLDQIRLKKRVELTEQLESLAVMSRGLAHDLNNLITPIHTYLQLIDDRGKSGSDDEELLRIAARNLDTIRSYVREAVFFSNTLTPKISLIPLDDFFENLKDLCKHQLDKHEIGLICEISEPFDFYADLILIQRLLSNLVFNAIDASPEGSTITLRAIKLPRVAGRPAWMRFQVIDRGSGISKENLSRVFAPYFSTKNIGDQTRGFGLGLTICQKIVHLHRGTISLQSTEGQGTTVQIDFPMEPAEHSAGPLPS